MWPLTWGFCSYATVRGIGRPTQVVLACVDHGSPRLHEDKDEGAGGAAAEPGASVPAHLGVLAGADPRTCVRLISPSVARDSLSPCALALVT
jgi:hypothetical protein